ncbi:MAG: 1-deoxy-D-xylulose-5-phosphate synthase [bacterium]|nr:1-deoxy-D-xylulose-5-phosphate synthase [bacterium]
MPRLIESIASPADLRALPEDRLDVVCRELREFVIEVITQVGGHLGASLGVVELTVALHRVFETPRDVLVWDVGHQAYIHKLLTGRRTRFATIRQYRGLSGFLKRSESEHDQFGAGHASTSISAALGFAEAAHHLGQQRHVAAIIGDGSMTGGLAMEALNNAGISQRDLLVILNDNTLSISPNVGALSRTFTEMTTSPRLNRLRDQVWEALGRLPDSTSRRARELGRRLEESLHSMVTPGLLFNEFGFRYFGPVDGHDLPGLIRILERLKQIRGPRLLHVLTVKGKGLEVAEKDPVKYHGVGGKLTDTGDIPAPPPPPDRPTAPAYQSLVPRILAPIARRDKRLVAITAAMAEGTGLAEFARQFPERCYDVGIAEGHGVTFAAGLAAAGMRPVVCIYSTFLQRAVDSIVHDVALQHLPVLFLLDRAGLVGADGPTHHGTLDIAYLSMVPGMVVAAPADGNELHDLVATALAHEGGPFAIRYPKDNSFCWEAERAPRLLPLGSWSQLRPGDGPVLVATGAMVREALEAADLLAARGVDCGVVNARFIKPMDTALLDQLARHAGPLYAVEEGAVLNGFGAMLRQELAARGHAGRLTSLGLPDDWVEHGERRILLHTVGLTGDDLAKRVAKDLGLA